MAVTRVNPAAKQRRVVVTGRGAITPLGNNLPDTWACLLQGQSGICLIEDYDASGLSVRFAGLVKQFNLTQYLPEKEARKIDPFIHYAIAAAFQAQQDAQLDLTQINTQRVGTCIGSGIGGIHTIEAQSRILIQQGARKVSPFLISGSIANMAAGNISILLGLRGPNLSVTTACATGTHNIGLAARLIAYGDADVMFAGGAESGSSALGMAGFAAARALSRRNDAPMEASRPWDIDRDGFVLSDGAGVLVLEEYQHAVERGAPIYAELMGFGMSADACHITAPPEDGAGAYAAMANALKDASMTPAEVDYINAHGTSTPAGDEAEAIAIKQLFAGHCQQLAVSSTKSMLGHMLGAAGAVEAIITIQALLDQVAPPTINLQTPTISGLDFIPNQARPMKLTTAMSNSFGFGGTNGSLIFRRML